jgi:hypothetical protein
LVHPEIYRHARSTGEVFQAVHRDELTPRLGAEWRPGVHVPEIAGIPQYVLDTFSQRSHEIDARLEATGPQHDRGTPSRSVGDPTQQA